MLKMKDLEQFEEMWKSDARNQREIISRLEHENHRMSKALRDKIYDAKIRDGESTVPSSWIFIIRVLMPAVT